jgi:uncharacterized protein YdaU (DUF1376 family)
MRSLPWFPFWVDRFHASKWVRRMTAEQVGIYILLLAEQWDAGAVADDDNELSYICRAPIDEVRTVLAWCFDLNEEGMWINPALEMIRAEQEDKANMRSLAGRKGAESRWNKGTNGDRMATASGSYAIPMAIEKRREEKEQDRKNEQPVNVDNSDGLDLMLSEFPPVRGILNSMKHHGSEHASKATLRMRFLYADVRNAMPDPSVKGLDFGRRREIVAEAFVEMLSKGRTEEFDVPSLASFVRRLRSRPPPTSEAASVKDGDPQWEATKRAALEAEKRAVAALNVNATVDDGAPSVNVNIARMPVADTRYDGRKKTKAIIDLLTAKRASE